MRYNNAHKELPNWCYMMDIDSVEIRGTKPVALIEYKQMNRFENVIEEIRKNKSLDWQMLMYKKIAKALEIPCYLVGYSYEEIPQTYKVLDFKTKKIITMPFNGYQKFLMNL